MTRNGRSLPEPAASPLKSASDTGAAAGVQSPVSFRILHEFPTSSDERAWREFLARADWPSHYATPEYFWEPRPEGTCPFAVLAIEGHKVAAVLTGSHEEDFTNSGNPCLPQTCFDPSTDCSRSALTLAQGLLAEAGSSQLVTIYGWTRMPALQGIGFRLRTLTGVVMLDLRQGAEALFRQMHRSRRTNVRYAIKHGVEVFEAHREEDIVAYYAVYSRWRQAPRMMIPLAQDPFPLFAKRYTRRDNRRLFLARYGGQIIAGVTIRFSRGGLLENQESSSLDEYLHLHPNDLLIWKTIEWGSDEGFSRYSLGGHHRFFLRTGGTLTPVYRCRLDRTWVRRHDLREALESNGMTRVLLPPLRTVLRTGRALRRSLTGRGSLS